MAAGSDDTYWILGKQQIEALVSPRRHEIGDVLAASGPLSIRELAEQLGVPPSGLYHHINKLLKVGLVIEAGTRVIRRKREQLYSTPAPRMRLAKALGQNKNAAVMVDVVNSLTRQMGRDFQAGIASASKVTEGEERNLGFFRVIGRPSPAQLARINANLAEIAEVLWNSAGADGPVISLGWVMAPRD